MIRHYQPSDLKAIVVILNYYVKNDSCTFQIKPYTFEELENKFNKILSNYPILITEINHKVVGFAYGAPWREKAAYAQSVETTIYVHPNCKNAGIGQPLYNKLLETLSQKGFHLLVSCITLPNAGSVRLHEKLGFEKVGEFKEAGMKFDQWYTVGFWQKVLT